LSGWLQSMVLPGAESKTTRTGELHADACELGRENVDETKFARVNGEGWELDGSSCVHNLSKENSSGTGVGKFVHNLVGL